MSQRQGPVPVTSPAVPYRTEITASEWDRIRNELFRLSQITVAPPLTIMKGPTGIAIGLGTIKVPSAVKLVQVFDNGTLPTEKGRVYACHPVTVDFDNEEDAIPSVTVDSNKTLYAANFRQNYLVVGAYYLAVEVGGKLVIDNQATFLEDL